MCEVFACLAVGAVFVLRSGRSRSGFGHGTEIQIQSVERDDLRAEWETSQEASQRGKAFKARRLEAKQYTNNRPGGPLGEVTQI